MNNLFFFFRGGCGISGEDMQWGEPRPRHIRDPKTRAHEDSLQVIPAYYYYCFQWFDHCIFCH